MRIWPFGQNVVGSYQYLRELLEFSILGTWHKNTAKNGMFERPSENLLNT